jgi:hypothetical protein
LCNFSILQEGLWRNGSASDSRSEGWAFESLWPHFLAHCGAAPGHCMSGSPLGLGQWLPPPLASYVAEGPCHHRSHFGSRYLTRADAGTQAFLLAASGVCICRRFSQCGGSISHTQQDHPGTPRTTHPTHKDRNTHTHSHTLAHQLRMSSAVCVPQFDKFFRVLQQSHSFCEALTKLRDSPHQPSP